MKIWYKQTKLFSQSKLEGGCMKTVIMLHGFPGTGKTTAAHKIRSALSGVEVISRDFFVEVDQASLEGVRTLEQYSQRIRDTHELFYQEIERRLSTNEILVVDSVFRAFELRERVYEIARKGNARCFVVRCICERGKHLQRLDEKIRGGKWIFKTPEELLSLYNREAQPLTEEELHAVDFLEVDTAVNTITYMWVKSAEACAIARELIKAWTSASG
jgi:predicted kinase